MLCKRTQTIVTQIILEDPGGLSRFRADDDFGNQLFEADAGFFTHGHDIQRIVFLDTLCRDMVAGLYIKGLCFKRGNNQADLFF